MNPTLALDRPAFYEIAVRGRLQADWSDWLTNLQIECENCAGQTITVLRGTVADQAALFGLLDHIRDLGLPLLLVRYIPRELDSETEETK